MIRLSPFILLASAVLVSGCLRPVVTGRVVNLQGEGLPGVVVREKDSSNSTLTDAIGYYSIGYRPGSLLFYFSKTGYTAGQLQLAVEKSRRVEARDIALWQLPSRTGVYLFEGYRYLETTRAEPQRLFLTEGDLVYATTQQPATGSATTTPLIVCYKTPKYDARLSRLKRVQVKRSATDTEGFEAWTEAGTMRADLRPIDEAQGLLLQLALERPLDPGLYAVHWGALEGQSFLDKRVYLFRVDEPAEVVAPIPEESPSPADDSDAAVPSEEAKADIPDHT